MYYVYKISIPGCRKFYIGATKNPEKRHYEHCLGIRKTIKDISQYGRGFSYPAHIYFAKHVMRANKKAPDGSFQFKVRLRVLDKCDSVSEVSNSERNLISINRKYALNGWQLSKYTSV